MKTLLVAASILLLVAASATAADSGTDDGPLGFKQYKIGTQRSDLDLKAFECRSDGDHSLADEVCTYKPKPTDTDPETVGGFPISILILSFIDKNLDGITLRVARTGFDQVESGFESRYGKPTQTVETGRNGLGLKLESKTSSWKQGGADLVMRQGFPEESSIVAIYSVAYQGRLVKQKSEKAKADM